MTNGELIDMLLAYPREMELYHPRYTIDQRPGDNRLVVDAGRRRAIPPPPLHREDGITEITLTQGKITVIKTKDWYLAKDYKWHARMSSDGRWYATTAVRSGYYPDGRPRFTGLDLHQLILPNVAIVDHRDGDGLNNIDTNLRAASQSMNAFNQNKGANHGLSQYKTGKWSAHLRVGTRNGYLGTFNTREEARTARDAAEASLPDGYSREAVIEKCRRYGAKNS